MTLVNFIHNYQKKLIIGASGSGKTTLALDLLSNAQNMMIVDTNLEITRRLNLPYTRKLSEWDINKCYFPSEYSSRHLDAIIKKARTKYNHCLFIDDLDAYQEEGYVGKELKTLMVNARHQNIGIIITMKRPVNIPLLVVQNSHYVSLFTINARDLDIIAEWNTSLNYPKDVSDLGRLAPYTFALFAPSQAGKDATDPKQFLGFFRLAKERLK